MITRRDWWIGVALVTAAILVHALVPRYDYRHPTAGGGGWYGGEWIVIDRWTGDAEMIMIPRAPEP